MSKRKAEFSFSQGLPMSQSQGTFSGAKRRKYNAKKRVTFKNRNYGNITNKNVTGYVRQVGTDLMLSKVPFNPVRYHSFVYENELTPLSGATNVLVRPVAFNDLYDFDRDGNFGNKQPLYFDALLSASGPYRNFKVISWVTTYTIVNATTGVPLTVWAMPPMPLASDIDSVAEADNMPGVKRAFLTGREGGGNKATITTKGHIGDVFPTYMDDASLQGNWQSSPSAICHGALIVKGSDGSTAPSVYVAIKHVAFTMLSGLDALVS